MTDERRWRVFSSALAAVAVGGVVLAILDTRGLPGFQPLVNRTVWGTAAMPMDVVTYHRFLHAVLGGVIAGWAITMAVVARSTFDRRATPWRAIGLGLVVWFVIDTGGSLAYGIWPNALLNGVCMAAAAVALWLTRPRPGAERSGP